MQKLIHESNTRNLLMLAERLINDDVPTETQSEINQFDEVFDLPLSNIQKQFKN